jgi:hypothetical protein
MLLLIVLFALALATPKDGRMPTHHRVRTPMDDTMTNMQACRTLVRDDLQSCFSSLVDTNHDNSLSAAEVSTFLTAQNIPAATVLMKLCDTNKDNALDSTDWSSPNACAQSQPIITRACYICVKAGWTPPSLTTTTAAPTTAPSK